MRLRSPIVYIGGKGIMVSKLLPILTAWAHRRYCEPFGGGASVLIAKPPVEVETYNDINGELVNFFKVLADPHLFKKFYRRVALLPHSRALYTEYGATWYKEEDIVERAVKWFVVARQSFSGRFGKSLSFIVTTSSRGMASTASRWLSCINMLPQIHARLQRVQIECRDFRFIITTYDTDSTLFYCDPPYIPETRTRGLYQCEMSNDDHRDLVRLLLSLKGAAVLSGYRHEIYEPLEDAGWQRIDWPTACYAAGRTRGSKLQGIGSAKKHVPRVESVWLHPKVAQAYNPQYELLPKEMG